MGQQDDILSLSDIFPLREDIDESSYEGEATEEDRILLAEVSRDQEITTSYLLVNTLLNLLIKKEIIKHSEVNEILSELHQNYIQSKR